MATHIIRTWRVGDLSKVKQTYCGLNAQPIDLDTYDSAVYFAENRSQIKKLCKRCEKRSPVYVKR